MTYTLEPGRTVAELAIHVPGAARIFDRAGIDFCCGGGKTLRVACEERGLALEEVLGALEYGASQPDAAATDAAKWERAPLGELTTHIVSTHHQYVRTETPRIEKWLEKCIAAHGERHPELLRLRHTFQGMASEMATHMAKEELILFPAIARLASPPSEGRPGATCFESLAQPVRMMMIEHDHSGKDLGEMRAASGEFTPPPDACGTYRALYQALEDYDADMRRHVHLENNILFPRALELEREHGSRGNV
ncbi:MAG: iron-sulfur cluster repair di-iron protein [Terriglobales bacterium]